ncbi:HIT domain-containing protein [Candidatus Saccharibacteria bacterium]|nr:MAG: HIT domain-containing protein [Candidatus Saccharibacteria bacterium]
MSGECAICPILETKNDGQDVVVLETQYWRASLAADQRSLGRMFVTLLEHKESLSELSEAEFSDLQFVVKALEGSLKKTYQPTHFNWSCLMNNAVRDGQPTHVHWHVHPRYDREVIVNGETFIDGNDDKTPHHASLETLETIQSEIVSNISGKANRTP